MKTDTEVTMMEIDDDPFDEYPDMEDIDAKLAIERSRLLCLPVEVLQLVLLNMDAATYFTSLRICKTVFEAAHSRRVILHHLNRLPGLRLGLESLDNGELLTSFRRRAAKALCAAGTLANITRYAPSDDLVLSRTIFYPGKTLLMATAHEHGVVNIYEISSGWQIRQKAELRTQTLFDDELRQNYRMEVVKMAFSGEKDLAVLCRARRALTPIVPIKRASPSSDSSDDEEESTSINNFRLVIFHHCHSKLKGHFYSSEMQETRDIEKPSNRLPVGLALATNGTACVTWMGNNNRSDIILYARDIKKMAQDSCDPSPSTLSFDDNATRTSPTSTPRLISTPTFSPSDKVLNFHSPGHPIHAYYTYSVNPLAQHSGAVHPNKEYVSIDGNSLFTAFSIGIPFHGAHYDSISVDDTIMCRTSYLAVAVQRDYEEEHPSAFIVQCDHDADPMACTHTVDHHLGRRISTWKPLALLAGYRQGASSLGTILAISPSGTHIATAVWNTILIWSLDPSLLLDGNLDQYLPKVDYNPRKGFGRLRPVRLRPEGVVHALCWGSESSLWAVTDRGVVRWECGVLACGEREVKGLPCDAPGVYGSSLALGVEGRA